MTWACGQYHSYSHKHTRRRMCMYLFTLSSPLIQNKDVRRQAFTFLSQRRKQNVPQEVTPLYMKRLYIYVYGCSHGCSADTFNQNNKHSSNRCEHLEFKSDESSIDTLLIPKVTTNIVILNLKLKHKSGNPERTQPTSIRTPSHTHKCTRTHRQTTARQMPGATRFFFLLDGEVGCG